MHSHADHTLFAAPQKVPDGPSDGPWQAAPATTALGIEDMREACEQVLYRTTITGIMVS